jgi:hypothetical protein
VALLPALFATGTPALTARPAQEGKLQRTIFTVARRTARHAPAIRAVRQALRQTATQVAASRDGIEVLPAPPTLAGQAHRRGGPTPNSRPRNRPPRRRPPGSG